MKTNPKNRKILRVFSILFGIAALLTVMPFPGAKETSIMGYKALCPFMPISTIISLYLSVTIHRYLSNVKQ